MSLTNALGSSSSPSLSIGINQKSFPDNANGPESFVDRRRSQGNALGRSERRQFGSSHSGLSDAGHELALAIDQYKAQHHRRYLTYDEMLMVIRELGYSKSAG